jgi:hypothetical protein
MNEMELWNQRRHELVREVESGRPARRPKKALRLWGVLSGWALEAAVRMRAEDAGWACGGRF